MATETFVTDYKFNEKSATKVLSAMERERKAKPVRVNVSRLSEKSEIRDLLRKSSR
ncbi:hypothetical protein ACFOU0_12100 [Salinicoccus sesuvii]|uniref:Uncharacterized protein n=1 Tax=Salinicoccus sesuvii TaxID=868281 RepID=A0ABV7NA19_9STAP